MLAHNRENLVGRAIESILRQTLSNFEFIVVNNGSTDRSGEIAEDYAARDARVKVVHRVGNNIGSGRNAGLYLASGEYVAFIDDDDYAYRRMLEFLYGLAVKYDSDISVCGSEKEDGGQMLPNIVYDELRLMDASKATEEYLYRKLYNAAMPTKLVRRRLCDKVRFNETGKYDDISTTYRYFVNARRVAAHGLPHYCFYRHPGNNSSAATKFALLNAKQLEEYLRAFRERTDYIRSELPEVGDCALYSEWSYMISMVEKIDRYKPKADCGRPLSFMREELSKYCDEFLSSPYIQPFEKIWMERYIISVEQLVGACAV
jgi:glycosyltransferase involved in cell wall biosynthesis